MPTTTISIENLCDWSPAKRVETKNGPRNLRKAKPNEAFWNAWRADKAALKAVGVSCGKDFCGYWEACWWQPISAEEQAEAQAAQEASRATDADIIIPAPEGLKYLPYQRAGIAYASDRDSVLIGDEMGLGKTIQAIGVVNADDSIKRILIVCPASLRLNWKREFAKWSIRDLTIEAVNGGKPEHWQPANIMIVNYDVVKKHRERIDSVQWDCLILDECHMLKNAKTARTKAVYGTKSQPGIRARKRILLTGTPIVNRPIELWPMLQTIDPDGLGKNFMGFAKKYCDAYDNGYGWDFSGASNLDQLQRLLRERFMVRRLKADVLTELPPKRRQVLLIPANGASAAVKRERKVYEAYQDAIDDLEAKVELTKAGTPEEYAAARQAYATAVSVAFIEMAKNRHEIAMAKVPHVIEHLESALEGGPVVCFAHHKDVVAALVSHFGDRCVTLTGETSMADRQIAVDRFQAGDVQLFIGNIKAAGVGITLTKSSHVVFAELDLVPGNLTQAEDRTHRIGQTDNNVLVQHIVLEGSLDETMIDAVIAKQDVIDSALDAPIDDVPVTRNQPATIEIDQAKLAEAADEIDDEERYRVHEVLRILAGRCDGAFDLDGQGFNKIDSRIGKSLAAERVLSPRQALLGQKIIKKYHRQLSTLEVQ